MRALFSRLFFSRLLAGIAIANFATLALLNAVRAPVASTPGVYLSFLMLALLLLRRVRPRHCGFELDRLSAGMLVFTMLLLTLPRMSYLFDWVPGNPVLAHSDDPARLLEVLAMTASPSYPLQSPSNPDYLFSYYYCGLYPMAVIKLMLPFLTIKECVALGNIVYHGLLLLSLAEIALLILRDRVKVRLLVFFCTLFGGFDWLASGYPWQAAGHFEWWQTRFHANTQISSFYVALLWTVQHFLAAWCAVLAYAFLFFSRQRPRRWAKPFTTALLLATAAHTSPFAAVTVPAFVLVHQRVVWRRFLHPAVLALLPAFVIPLYLYGGRLSGPILVPSTFRLGLVDDYRLDRLLSLPAFLTLVPLVEMAAIPLVLLAGRRLLSRRQRSYVLIAWAFFALTFLVACRGKNNLSMRGMLLPQFVFYAVFAARAPQIVRRLRRPGRVLAAGALAVVVVLGLCGTLKEFAGRLRCAAVLTAWNYTATGRPPPPRLRYPVYEIARRRDVGRIDFAAAVVLGRRNIYDFEKFIQGLSLDSMVEWEKELIRRPLSHEN